MTSKQHYTVRVQGHMHYSDSRNFDAEYVVPNTVEPKDLLDYIKERVKEEGEILERELESPSSSCSSSFYSIESEDHESYTQIYWEEGDDLMLDGDYLVEEG